MLILGLDGLEYNFVEAYNCTHLKQQIYGQIDVPIHSQLKIPITPQVWGSFLTGKWLDDMAFSYNSRLLETSLSAIRSVKKLIPFNLGFFNKFFYRARRFPKLPYPTFIDLTDSSTLNAPFYDFENVMFQISQEFGRSFITWKEAVQRSYNHYEAMKEKIASSLPNRKNRVVFAYMLFPDFIQHLQYPFPKAIKRHYLDLNAFVKHIRYKSNDHILIVSDHGFDMKTKTHSMKGFYSTNKALPWTPIKITDFFQMIVNTEIV